MTLEQQLPGGGIAVPIIVNNQVSSMDAVPISEVNIDLGSAFAADLGFPSTNIKLYVHVEEENEAILDTSQSESPGRKKKKNKNNKKKKKK